MITTTLDENEGRAKQLEFDCFKAQALREDLDLVPDTEFAKALNLEPQTLAGWRSEGKGPAFTKLGKTVFYRRGDVKRWVGRSTTFTKDDPAPPATREVA